MKQKKRYEDDLRAELIRLNLYQERNERIIKCAALNQWFVDSLEDELRRHSFTLRTVGSMGQTKVAQHPHVESIRRYNHEVALNYAQLGMGNKETLVIEKENELEQFLHELEL